MKDLIRNPRKVVVLLAGVVLFGGLPSLPDQTKRIASAEVSPPVSPQKIIRYVREKFGIAESVSMTVEAFRNSPEAGFYSSSIVVDDGKQKRTSNFTVSKNGRYLILGEFVALGSDPARDMERQLREALKLPANVNLTVGAFRNSRYAVFDQALITADDGKQRQSQDYFVTKDRKYLVLGSVFTLDIPPQVEALHTISILNQPSTGPANAPVTIIEYADLECPTCARLQELLENNLLPRYANKIRVVFKEFPLVNHDWALMAAVANQCAYRINPPLYLPYRTLIFQHQSGITAANARAALIQYGEEAGIDRVQLAACLDSQATRPQVEQNLHEGQSVTVVSTPTCFINGKVVVGAVPEDYYRAIDEALAAGGHAARASHASARAGQAGRGSKATKNQE